MNVSIPVRTRNEGKDIRRALEDPEVRAFVLVMGALLPLPSDRARRRCLTFVLDQLEEQKETARNGE